MASIVVCHSCDLVHRREPRLSPGRVCCARCHAELYRTHGESIDSAIALALSAAVLLALSNMYPLVELQLNGTSRATTLLGAALGLYAQGYGLIGALVLLTTLLIPLFQVGGMLYLLLPLRAGRRASRQNELFRALTWLRPWAMSEVFMLGALVAVVKLAAMAEVVPGISLFCYGALMLTLTALTSVTPTEQFWLWVEQSRA